MIVIGQSEKSQFNENQSVNSDREYYKGQMGNF